MRGFSGDKYDVKAGFKVVHPNFAGHKNIEFIVSNYDVECGEVVRNDGSGGKVLNLDICQIKPT